MAASPAAASHTAAATALDRLARLRARLDARRRTETAPGQLGLDLSGGSPAGSRGQACGQGHISRDKTCRKGTGSTPATPKATSGATPSAGASSGTGRRPNPPGWTAPSWAGSFVQTSDTEGPGLRVARSMRGDFTYRFKDRDAAQAWLAKEMADGLLEGGQSRRSPEYKADLAAWTRDAARMSDQELLEGVEGLAMAGKATRGGTAVRVVIGADTRPRSQQQPQAAEPAEPVLSNPPRTAPAKPAAPKAKPELTAQDVDSPEAQLKFARQQKAAAAAAGDQAGAKAWADEQAEIQRRRLAQAQVRQGQTQASLFGVTEYDNSLPLFNRRDGADPVTRLLQRVLAEQLPGAKVLDWQQARRGLTSGRVAAEGLVYAYRCDSESVAYRPAWEGLTEAQWEARSTGFLQVRDPSMRLDYRRSKGPRFNQLRTKRQCSRGYSCGKSCISLERECRITPQNAMSKARLRQLQALASEGDPMAQKRAESVEVARLEQAAQKREQRNVQRLQKLMERPEVAELVRTGKLPQQAAAGADKAKDEDPQALAGKVRDISPEGIKVDPKRFQYKIVSNEQGEVGSLSGVKTWDSNLAGIVLVWVDPKDGQTYVVNGHNRLALAKRLGAEEVTVRYLRAKDAKQARAIGAMQNIAEGSGTDLDAAKFIRDTGIKSEKDLEDKGLPLRSGRAARGLSLSKLPPELFDEVVRGDLSPARGAIIGGSGLSTEKQREIGKLLRTKKSLSDGTLQEYVEALRVSEQSKQSTLDLFGSGEETVDNGLLRAGLASGLKAKLKGERRLFATVSRSKAAEELTAKAGNVINKEESSQVANQADTVLRAFDQLKNQSGPVSDALNRAAARIRAGESKAAVQRELHEAVIEAMQEELRRAGLAPPKPNNEAPSGSLFDSLDARLDALRVRLDAPRNCVKGLSCGSTCIPKNRQCRKQATQEGAARLATLVQGSGAPEAAPQRQGQAAAADPKPPAPAEPEGRALQGSEPRRSFRAMAKAAGRAIAEAVGGALGRGKSSKAAPTVPSKPWQTKTLDEFIGKGVGEIAVEVTLDRPAQFRWGRSDRLVIHADYVDTRITPSTVEALRKSGHLPDDGSEPRAIAISFGVGPNKDEAGTGYDRLNLPPDQARRLALQISKEVRNMIKDLPDGQLVSAAPWEGDGAGNKRRSLYERAGFYFHGPKAFEGVAMVKGGKIVPLPKPGRADSEPLSLEELIEGLLALGDRNPRKRGAAGRGDRIDSLVLRMAALQARLDARRKPGDAPGQMGFDFNAPTPSGGQGQPCGQGHIAKGLTCHKGGGGAMAPASQPQAGMGGSNEGQRPGRLSDALKASIEAMKAADVRQMSLMASQLFETEWTLEKRGKYRGMTKEQAQQQYIAEFAAKLQQGQAERKPARVSQQSADPNAPTPKLSEILRQSMEALKEGDRQMENLTRDIIDLRVKTAGMEWDDESQGGDLGGGAGRRSLRGRLDALATRLDAPRNCVKGISCGNTCIPKGRNCRVKGTSEGTARLGALVRGGEPAAAKPAEKPAAAKPVPTSAKGYAVKRRTERDGRDLITSIKVPLAEPVYSSGRGGLKPREAVYARVEFSRNNSLMYGGAAGDTRRAWLKGQGVKDKAMDAALSVEFSTGFTAGGQSHKRLALPEATGRRVGLAIARELRATASRLPDGTVLLASAYAADGYGAARRRAYEAAGFHFPELPDTDPTHCYAVVRGGRIQPLRAAMARRRGRADSAGDPLVEALLALPELGGGRKRSRAAEVLDRLDALKRKCSTGYSCGSTCISVKKECRGEATSSTSKERIRRLQQLARGEISPRGVGTPKPAEAHRLAASLQSQRQQQQALIKAERERLQKQAGGSGRAKVVVQLRRARPGGEYGPDGHWYPGGAWMSEGRFVGAKAQAVGQGQVRSTDEKAKGADQGPRVIRNKAPKPPPIEPKGQGLPAPQGLKKRAQANDDQFFNERGFVLWPRRPGMDGLMGTNFVAAVAQRMTAAELGQVLDGIRSRLSGQQLDDFDYYMEQAASAARPGGSGGFDWMKRGGLLAAVDEERYVRAYQLLNAGVGSLGLSPARARKREKEREWDEDGPSRHLTRSSEEQYVWELNNIFRAVTLRRRAGGTVQQRTAAPFEAQRSRPKQRIDGGEEQVGSPWLRGLTARLDAMHLAVVAG